MGGSHKPYLVAGAVVAAAVAVMPGGGAQGAASCPPGTEMPTITAQDFEAGSGGALTATHTIDVDANFASGQTPDNLQFSAPPGVVVRPQGPTGAKVFSDTPGPVPVTVSWTEFQSDGSECSASTSVTLQLQAAAPLSFGRPPKGLKGKFAKYSAGWSWVAVVQRYTDLRPVELRYRGVRRARLPGPAMPFKIVKVALRTLDPGFGVQRFLRSPHWEVMARTTYQKPLAFILESRVNTGSSHDKPVGYELQVLQGGRLLFRVREAGKCNFGSCRWRTLKLERGK
jgi:hypothetical protein